VVYFKLLKFKQAQLQTSTGEILFQTSPFRLHTYLLLSDTPILQTDCCPSLCTYCNVVRPNHQNDVVSQCPIPAPNKTERWFATTTNRWRWCKLADDFGWWCIRQQQCRLQYVWLLMRAVVVIFVVVLLQCIKCDIRRSAGLRLILSTVTLLLASCVSLINVVSCHCKLTYAMVC